MQQMNDQEQIKKFEMFLKAKNKRTAAAYMRDINRLLEFTGKPIAEITNLDISNFFNYMRGKGHNERSILRYGAAFKKFFKLCNRPMIALYIETPTYQVPPPTWLTEKQVRNVIAHAQSDQAKVILQVSYDLALRIGEVKLLKKQWYNTKNRQIKVYREKSRGAPNEYILELAEETNKLLKEYLESSTDKGVHIFPVSTELVTYYYRNAATAAGIDYHVYTFHSIRHSSITHKAIEMLQKEGQVDLARLAKFAGHLRMETTLLYIHLASEYISFKKE